MDVEEEILHVEKENEKGKKRVAVGPRTWKASSEISNARSPNRHESIVNKLASRIGFTGGGPRAN